MAERNEQVLPPINLSLGKSQTSSNQIQVPNNDETLVGPSSKDMMIGAGALLVLAIIIFFIRLSFVNFLIGPMKRSPNNAGMAGWGLFGGLFFGAILGCAAIVSKTYMTLPLIIAMSVLSLICLIIAIVVASKK